MIYLKTRRTAHSIVVPLRPSTNWPLMNKPVLKDVLPLYTSVSHLRENMPGMVQTIVIGKRWSRDKVQLDLSETVSVPLYVLIYCTLRTSEPWPCTHNLTAIDSPRWPRVWRSVVERKSTKYKQIRQSSTFLTLVNVVNLLHRWPHSRVETEKATGFRKRIVNRVLAMFGGRKMSMEVTQRRPNLA